MLHRSVFQSVGIGIHSTLPLQTKEGAESLRIYREAFSKYDSASRLIPEDAFALRSWGDALHDCAKKLVHCMSAWHRSIL